MNTKQIEFLIKKSNTYATLVMVKWTLNGKKATIWLAVYKIQLL